MQGINRNFIKNLLTNLWISRWVILFIWVSACGFFGYLYKFKSTYSAKGTLLVQKAQNSAIQEISADLGRMSSGGFSFGRDLYIEKFMLYLTTRDYFLKAAEVLMEDHRIKDLRTELKITDDDLKVDSKYLPKESQESRDNRLKNTLASLLQGSAMITKSGALGLELSARASKPGIAIILTENLMKAAPVFIMEKELQELNAAKEYIEENLAKIETELSTLFNDQINDIKTNPKIQQANRKVLLEKITRISTQIDSLKADQRRNQMIIKELASQRAAQEKVMDKGDYKAAGKLLAPEISLRDQQEALTKKRILYLNSGLSADSALVKQLDKELAETAKLVEMAQPEVNELTNPFTTKNSSASEQMRSLEQENFLIDKNIKSLRQSLRDTFAEGIDFATFEQKEENVLKKAEIRYSLYTELAKQLFRVEMYRISFQNKIIEIEKPSYRTISRRPTSFATIVLGFLTSIALSYLYLFYTELTDPIIVSPDDVRNLGVRILGYIPQIRFRFRITTHGPQYLIDHFIDNGDSIVFKNIRSKFIKSHADSGRTCSTCLVTSSRPSEGKSFFTLNISGSLANAGFRVLLIDTDARKQGLTKFQEKSEKVGLMEYLKGMNKLEDVLQSTVVEGVDIISAGTFSHNASELLMKQELIDLHKDMQGRYDFIFIDTAPILAVNDGIHLMHLADSVTIMGRVGQTKLKDITNVVEAVVEEGKDPQVVLNMSGNINSYYYHKKQKRFGGGVKVSSSSSSSNAA